MTIAIIAAFSGSVSSWVVGFSHAGHEVPTTNGRKKAGHLTCSSRVAGDQSEIPTGQLLMAADEGQPHRY